MDFSFVTPCTRLTAVKNFSSRTFKKASISVCTRSRKAVSVFATAESTSMERTEYENMNTIATAANNVGSM
jgi:hypothetical protein